MKELNDEELNQVSGGNKTVSGAKKEYRHNINDQAQISTGAATGDDMFVIGIIKKRGIGYVDRFGTKYTPCYYVECNGRPELNSWYSYFLTYTYMLKCTNDTVASLQAIEE